MVTLSVTTFKVSLDECCRERRNYGVPYSSEGSDAIREVLREREAGFGRQSSQAVGRPIIHKLKKGLSAPRFAV